MTNAVLPSSVTPAMHLFCVPCAAAGFRMSCCESDQLNGPAYSLLWGWEWEGGKLLCSQINFLVYLPVQLHECHCQHKEESKIAAKLKCFWTAIFRYKRVSMIILLILLLSRF